MTAEPLMRKIIDAANAAGLDLLVIGNAAAALQGVPISTLDINFFVRDTQRQLPKIRAFAKRLGATVTAAACPMSRMVKVENAAEGIFLDLLDHPAGMPSFAAVRSRATELSFTSRHSRVYVACLAHIIASKKSLGRPKDLAVLPLLETASREQERLARKTPRTGS